MSCQPAPRCTSICCSASSERLHKTEPSLLVAQFAVVLPFVGVTAAIIKRFRCAALADGELRLENPGQVLVNQQTVLNEDFAAARKASILLVRADEIVQ